MKDYKERCRSEMGIKELLGGCPREYVEIMKYIDNLKYFDTPNYQVSFYNTPIFRKLSFFSL